MDWSNINPDDYEIRFGWYGGLVGFHGGCGSSVYGDEQGMADLARLRGLYDPQQSFANQQALAQSNMGHFTRVYDPRTDSFTQGPGVLSKETMKAGLEALQKTKTNERKIGIMNSFKLYLDKHRDTIFTVALVFLADHYILKGALKERLQRLLEGILTRAENSLHKEIGQ